ncbi:MAG TPA: hypothetical protein VJA21_27825 [Verrucomicrobiae bacterium]
MTPLKIATRILQAGVVAGICVLIWLIKSTPSAPQATTPAAPPPPVTAREPASAPAPESPAASPVENQWGIQVLGLSLTNNDTAVEVRYTVTAPEKTLLLSQTNANAYLLDQATGAQLSMIAPPRSGTPVQGASLRTTRRMARFAGRFPPAPGRIIPGRVYSLEIPNWGLALTNGSKVSFVVNDFRQDDLTVE